MKKKSLISKGRKEAAPAVAFVPEIENLESRILLSGIGTGTKRSNVTFTDADGDTVRVSISGRGFFDIALDGGLTNNADIDSITITNATASSILSIVVTPRQQAAAVPGVTGAVWSNGMVEVNTITDTLAAGTDIRAISLNSANVQSIDLAGVDITGGIVVTTQAAQRVDLINSRINSTTSVPPAASAPLVDLHDITADNILGGITVRGSNLNFADITGSTTSDLLGAITVPGTLGGITNTIGVLGGTLNFGVLSGPLNVGTLATNVTTTGDITLNLPNGLAAGVAVNAGGNVHLFVGSGGGVGLAGTITAGLTVSGLNKASTVDAITVNAGLTGVLSAGTDIANISVLGAGMNGTIAANGNLGNVTLNANSFGGIIVNGNVGNITSTAQLGLGVTAGGNIGNISDSVSTAGVDGITGFFTAAGTIGTVTSSVFNGNAFNGANFNANSIGNVSATVTNVGGGHGIFNTNFTAQGGDIGTVLVKNSSLGGSGIYGSNFNATGDIGAVTTTSAGYGIRSSNFNADTDASGAGNLGAFSVTMSTSPVANVIDGINSSNFNGVGIGNVAVVQGNANGADGIDSSNFAATTGGIGTVTVTDAGNNARGIYNSNFFSQNGIGAVAVTNSGLNASGIYNSNFNADTNNDGVGALGNVAVTLSNTTSASRGISGSNFFGGAIGTVDVTVADTKTGSVGIYNSLFQSSNATTKAGVIGAVTVTNASKYGVGIYNTDFYADNGVGNVSATAGALAIGNGSDFDGDFDASGAGSLGTITAVSTGTATNNEQAIFGATFKGATIGAVTASIANVANSTQDTVENSTFDAVSIGLITVTGSTKAGSFAVDNTTIGSAATTVIGGLNASGSVNNLTINGTKASLGQITVVGNLDLANDVTGVKDMGAFNVSGQLNPSANTKGIGDGSGTVATTIIVGSKTTLSGDDFYFNFTTYAATAATIAGVNKADGDTEGDIKLN